MKTFLLGTTAVVGLGLLIPAPVYAAEPVTLTVNGSARVRAFVVSQDDSATFTRDVLLLVDDASFNLYGRGVADNGLRYGAAIKFSADDGGSGVVADEKMVWLEGGWGRLELGNDDGADAGMGNHGGDINSGGGGGYDGSPSLAFDFNGVGNSSPGIKNGSGDATKITYFTPRIKGIQVGASFSPDTDAEGDDDTTDNVGATAGFQDQISFGINYVQSFDDVGIRLSYVMNLADAELNETQDVNSWAIGAQTDFGNISVAAGYGDSGDSAQVATSLFSDVTWADFSVRYKDGPMTVSAGYMATSVSVSGVTDDDEVKIFSLGSAYSVAPGLAVTLGFDYIDVDQDGTADDNNGTLISTGISMAF